MYLFDVYVFSNTKIPVEVKDTVSLAFFTINALLNIMLHLITFQETDMRMLWNAK